MVKEFHIAMNVLECTLEDKEALRQRINVVREEAKELDDALKRRHPIPEEILKECCDVVYVAVGTAVKFGMNFDEAFKRVHESNMNKIWPDGKIHYRDYDGKVLKPPDYKPPYLGDLI